MTRANTDINKLCTTDRNIQWEYGTGHGTGHGAGHWTGHGTGHGTRHGTGQILR